MTVLGKTKGFKKTIYLEKLHLVKMRFDWSPHLGTSAGSGSVCLVVNELAMYCADVAPVIKIGQG